MEQLLTHFGFVQQPLGDWRHDLCSGRGLAYGRFRLDGTVYLYEQEGYPTGHYAKFKGVLHGPDELRTVLRQIGWVPAGITTADELRAWHRARFAGELAAIVNLGKAPNQPG